LAGMILVHVVAAKNTKNVVEVIVFNNNYALTNHST